MKNKNPNASEYNIVKVVQYVRMKYACDETAYYLPILGYKHHKIILCIDLKKYQTMLCAHLIDWNTELAR